MMKENKLTVIASWFLVGAAALLPVFFYPFIINPLINSKLLLTFVLGFIVVALFIALSIKRKSWEITKTPFTLPLFIFGILVAVSSLVSHQYPTKQLLGMGGAYLVFTTIIILAPTLIEEKISKYFSFALNISAVILSVLTIFQMFGLGLPMLINKISILGLPNSLAFSLTGATFVGVQFLSVVLLSNVLDQKAWQKSLFKKISTLLMAIALGISIWAILPGGEAKFQSLSFINSVAVSKNSLALTKNALFGYGPDSYGNAYNILKPVSVNGMSYWNFTFDSGFDLPLTLLVSTGLIAFLAYLFFVVKVALSIKKQKGSIFLRSFIVASLVWQLFAPVNLVMLLLLAIALILLTSKHKDEYRKVTFKSTAFLDFLNRDSWHKVKKIFFFAANGLFSIALLFAIYIVSRTFIAYGLLYQSSESVSKNEIAKAYDYHKQAKVLAPEFAFIRRSYSLLNLQIAIALSNKTNISPAEQEQVLQLVNQAIGEAKAATILDPANYQNWLVLAQIYMQLLDTTSQAQQEAFNSLAKAASYNPNNPEVRINLGQLFFNKQRYSEAITFFEQAAERKPDMYLAHYYLAKALFANDQLTEAKASYINALNLLDKSSNEYKQIENELNTLISKINSGGSSTDQNGANSAPTEPLAPVENPDAVPAPEAMPTESTESSLSGMLNQKEAESIIQESALTPDQNLVEN